MSMEIVDTTFHLPYFIGMTILLLFIGAMPCWNFCVLCWSLLCFSLAISNNQYKIYGLDNHFPCFLYLIFGYGAKNDRIFNYFLIKLVINWRVVHLIINLRSYLTYKLSCIVYASVVLLLIKSCSTSNVTNQDLKILN
jgi:hypothetical protein